MRDFLLGFMAGSNPHTRNLGSFLVYECIMKDVPLLDASWVLSAFIFAGAAIEAWSIRTEYLKHKRL